MLLIGAVHCRAMLPMTGLAAGDTSGTAYAVEGGKIYFDSATGTITGADDGITSANIPAKIDGAAVTSIGERAFRGCTDLTSVVIPEGVTRIEMAAFSKCSGLTSVVVPEGVRSIGGLAFGNCTGLTSLEIPKSVTVINGFAFYGCSGLTSMVIPEGVSSAGDWMFFDCSGLKAVIIPDSVTSIGERAFYGCSSLESAIIPKNVTSIGEEAFRGCTGLTYVTIPSGVSYICEDAFSGCTGLSVVYFGGTKEQWESLGGDDAISGTGARVIFNNYPESSIDIATGETVFGSVIDNTLAVSGDVSASSPVYAAIYDENGKMISCEIMNTPDSADVSSGAKVKLIWVNAADLTAKSECMEFDLN